MGHGPAHGQRPATATGSDGKGVLHLDMGLQSFHVLHEILDTTAISSNLSSAAVPARMLYLGGSDRNICMLDVLQRCFRMLADRLSLESHGIPWRSLSE